MDRLAVETTRRQGLKAVLGAVILALPFGRAGQAHGSHVSSDNCKRGCLWAADGTYRRKWNACHDRFGTSLHLGTLSGLYNPLAGGVRYASAAADFAICTDRALLNKKATSYDCLQP